MINFNENGFVLKERDREIVIPIAREKGVHFPSTEKVLKSIPSLRTAIEEIQNDPTLDLNDTITIESSVGVKFHLLVTRYRASAPANLQYVISSLNKLAGFIRLHDCKFAIAPLIQTKQVDNAVMRNIIKGLYEGHESDIIFYLGDE